MKALIFYSNSEISIFILTAIEELINNKHDVYLLTTSLPGPLHAKAAELGANVCSLKSKPDLFRQCLSLAAFCRKHNIDFVFSHLQYTNLVALLTGFIIKATVFPMRHHADYVYLTGNRNGRLLDKLVNFFSRKILVVSEACKRHMIQFEGVPEKKIIVVPLYYNFALYDLSLLQTITEKPEPETLSLITISRMVSTKNHIDLLRVIKKLVDEGVKVKLVLLDNGPLEDELKSFVRKAELENHTVFVGRQPNVISYINNAHLMVHPSVSEASCQVTKEAGICGKTVLTVKGIGDFDEYIADKYNGFTVSKDNLEEELYNTLKSIYNNRADLPQMGQKLCESVKDKFDVANAAITYSTIIGTL